MRTSKALRSTSVFPAKLLRKHAEISSGLHGRSEANQGKQEEIWTNNQRFHSQFRQEQERLAREIQEVRKSQTSQTLVNNKRLETEKNLQQAMEKQGRDIAEMRKQLTLWTKNTSAREAYTCWVHQQANPNLSEIPIIQIPDLMQTNVEKGNQCSMGASNQIMGQALPPKLIHKSQCRCGLHLRFPVSNHHILLLISSK
ncbi:hypothetical protein PIB30_099911, partial [Stylosanthes scabra]|nr:hypothetical protein [Stylosanthes scabra]